MSRNTIARMAVAALATPLLMLGMAGAASAAELTPIAEYVDTTVADTEAQIGAVVEALGFEA